MSVSFQPCRQITRRYRDDVKYRRVDKLSWGVSSFVVRVLQRIGSWSRMGGGGGSHGQSDP